MGRPAPTLNRARLQKTLIAFLDQTMESCGDIDYRLVGTGAALLHGVSLPAADVDILVKDRRNVDDLNTALSSFQCLEPPTWLAETQQYYANYVLNGTEVGISTVEIASDVDYIETFGRGPWEHFALLPCGRYMVPAVALELRLITELYRNRPDRYNPIVRFMQMRGCDLDLIQRGICNIGLSQSMQDILLGNLEEPLPDP